MTTSSGSGAGSGSGSSSMSSLGMTNPTVEQATAQDAALTPALQSVLDTLAGTLNTNASQSSAALSTVTSTLKAAAKTVGTQQQAAIGSVLGVISNAVVNGSQLNENMLNSVVNTLAGTTNPPCAPGLTSDTSGYACEQSAVLYTPPVVAAQPILPPPPPPPPTIPQCPPGTVWDPQFSACVPPGYFQPPPPPPIPPCPPGTVMNPATGLCTPIAPPPPPPGGPQPPPPNFPPPPPPILPPPPGGPFPPQPVFNPNVGGPPPFSGSLGPCGGSIFTIPLGPLPLNTPQSQLPVPGGTTAITQVYNGQIWVLGFNNGQPCDQSPNPPGGPLPPSPPAPPAPTPPAPQPPAPQPPTQSPCAFNIPALPQWPAMPSIGSSAWCAGIDSMSQVLSQAGNGLLQGLIASAPGGTTQGFPRIPDPPLATLAFPPFAAVWLMVQAIWNGFACASEWAITGLTSLIIYDLGALGAAATSGQSVVIGLVLIRVVLRAFRHIRVGANEAVWATIDVNIEWPQAEGLIEYLINYASQYTLPDVTQAMTLYRGGWIDLATYNCWMKCNNASPDVYQPVFDASRPRPQLGERQQMLWRLRTPQADGNPAYLDQDYVNDLAVDGYHPAWQKHLYDIRHIPYTLREIRQLLDAGQATEQEVLSAFMDMGYDAAKAQAQATMEMVLTARRRESEIEGYTPARISQLFIRGAMEPPDVIAQMTALNYTQTQAQELMTVAQAQAKGVQLQKFANKAEADSIRFIEEGYILGTINSGQAKLFLMDLGADTDVASSIISGWDVSANISNAKAAVAAIKKGWRSGYMGTESIIDLLGQAGIIPDKASSLLSQWQLERSVDEKVQDATQILAQVAGGLLDGPTASIRLVNMGWNGDDSDVLVAEAQSKLAKAQGELEAKALAAQERAQKAELSAEKAAAAAALRAQQAAEKAAEQLAKQAITAAKAAAAALKKATPVSLLNKLLKLGDISREAYVTRMILMGYPEASAQLQADDACSGKTAACVSTAGPDDATLASLD